MAAISIQPSYMSGYTAPPTLLEDGVPVATLYWHAATYQPAPPKVTAPTGVTVQWSKAAYVFADFHKQTLYAPKSGQVCNIECDGLKPFPAPLAARAMGDWRPEQDKSGARYWAYRGNPVYRAADVTAEPPASRWQPLDL